MTTDIAEIDQIKIKYNGIDILKQSTKKMDAWELSDIMMACRGNIAEASRLLNISRSTVRTWNEAKKKVVVLFIEGRFRAFPEASYNQNKL
ncbi:hypothetical protein D6U78_11095 [Vibrio cholerae]|nr:hypothetical protein [Vibrio cholerae]